MRLLKKFEEYSKEGVVKSVTRDIERAKSLIKESERKLNCLKRNLEKLRIEDENANDYLEYCYDLIMLLVRAKLYYEGYSATGQGSHEAEVSYMRILGFAEKDVEFINQMRYFRNGILYYGTTVDKEYAEKVVKFTERIYPKLKEKMKVIK